MRRMIKMKPVMKEEEFMSIKVIIMDVDGTLSNSQKVITPKTKEAFN